MAEWWTNNVGENLLEGVEGDDSNPPKLNSAFILDFLSKIPAARASFLRVLPHLTAEERARLDPLYATALAMIAAGDEQTAADGLQRNWNSAGVRTTGRRGGTRIGGN